MKLGRKLVLSGLAVALAAGAAARLKDQPATSPAIALARTTPDASCQGSALPLVVSDSGPEETLTRIFAEIEANRLSNALQLTEGLLRQHPNYRLAHLIKGDLLLGRIDGLPELSVRIV